MKFKLTDGKFRSCEIVISRYNEDLAWTKDIPKHFDKFIYNKGEHLPSVPSPCQFTQLPNQGREGATYLHHIIQKYEKLSRVTIFVQGKPFDHCSVLIDMLNKISNVNDMFPLKAYSPMNNLIDWIRLNKSDGLGVMKKAPWLGKDPGFLEYWDYLFKTPCDPDHMVFTGGAQFAIPYKLIMCRPKIFYQKILKTVDYAVHPLEGYFLEGIWRYIFQPSVEIRS
jgi:hypothetical protein